MEICYHSVVLLEFKEVPISFARPWHSTSLIVWPAPGSRAIPTTFQPHLFWLADPCQKKAWTAGGWGLTDCDLLNLSANSWYMTYNIIVVFTALTFIIQKSRKGLIGAVWIRAYLHMLNSINYVSGKPKQASTNKTFLSPYIHKDQAKRNVNVKNPIITHLVTQALVCLKCVCTTRFHGIMWTISVGEVSCLLLSHESFKNCIWRDQ